jgi:multisubunit Na+/H+ antiporter MnhB subunit
MLRIQLSKPKSNQPETPRSQADRYAIRYGLITAIIIVIYNVIVQLTGDGGFELAHIGIFVILFFMIGYGMNKNRKWIRDDHALDDRMLFGLVMSVAVAIGMIALSGILALVNYHLVVSETIIPINDGFKFAVNAMGLFWGCLIFGFISTFIFSEYYTKN